MLLLILTRENEISGPCRFFEIWLYSFNDLYLLTITEHHTDFDADSVSGEESFLGNVSGPILSSNYPELSLTENSMISDTEIQICVSCSSCLYLQVDEGKQPHSEGLAWIRTFVFFGQLV